MEAEKATERIPIRELVRYYLRLGLLGFGGPVALVGQMEREMVGERKWPWQSHRSSYSSVYTVRPRASLRASTSVALPPSAALGPKLARPGPSPTRRFRRP